MASYILIKLGLLVSVIALLLQIISLAIPWWTVREAILYGTVYRYHSGLWVKCVQLDTSVGAATSCNNITDASGIFLP